MKEQSVNISILRRLWLLVTFFALTLASLGINPVPALAQDSDDDLVISPAPEPVLVYADETLQGQSTAPRMSFAQASPTSALAVGSTFSIHYLTEGTSTFGSIPCEPFPAEVKGAINHAAAIWGSVLRSNVPITVRACWGSFQPSILAQAAPSALYSGFAGALPGIHYHPALANAIAGKRLVPDNTIDINLTINSDIPWYSGTDGATPGEQYDLVTVTLKSLAYGMGIGSLTKVEDSLGIKGIRWQIYDHFMEDMNGTRLSNLPDYSNTLAEALTTAVYWGGAHGMAANGDARARVHTPPSWQTGESYIHLHDDFKGTPNSLMTAGLIAKGDFQHSPGPVTQCMLKDMGWRLVNDEDSCPSDTLDTDVIVTIGGDFMGKYFMEPPISQVEKYPAAGGPVVISSTTGANIIASMLQLRRQDVSGGWTGITQLMGVQEELIGSTYVFPRYHGSDPTKYQTIQIANYDDTNASVTVTIAGTPYGPYLVQPGSTFSFRDTSIDAGPVIVSSDGPRIIASLYELQRQRSSGKWTGQTQMMGIPFAQLSHTYVFPRYNNTLNDLDATLVFANVDTEPTEIIVEIGNDFSVSYNMPPNTSRAEKFPVAGGPVVIRSNDGAKIIASMLQLRRQDISGGWTGITQLMGVQEALIGTTYVFPRYHGSDPTKYQTIQIANYDDSDANVTVTIIGIPHGPFLVQPGSTFSFRDTSIDAGPVVVSSDGPRIIASLYELKRQRSSGKWTGQTQMMGIPFAQLSDTYVFPRYNNTLNDLDATLIFAVP